MGVLTGIQACGGKENGLCVLGANLQIVQKAVLGVLEWGTELTLSGGKNLVKSAKGHKNGLLQVQHLWTPVVYLLENQPLLSPQRKHHLQGQETHHVGPL